MFQTIATGLRSSLRPLLSLGAVILIGWSLLTPAPARADGADGAGLFLQHCAGCHVNGGNIIRRGKTLRMAALERQGLASQEAIAAIAADGIGQMSGYGAVLGDDGVEAVATWVWQQALQGWTGPQKA